MPLERREGNSFSRACIRIQADWNDLLLYMMKLKLFLFAGLSDRFGSSELSLEVRAPAVTVEQLQQLLITQYPQHKEIIMESYFAVNQAYATPDMVVRLDDELALIPPVSGGETGSDKESVESQPELYTISREALDVAEVTKRVADPNHGATLSFIGTTREYTHGKRTVLLEYEAYIPMALKTMEQIGAEIDERWPGTLCAIAHRIGRVDIGEISVIIGVSAPHRPACYEASRYAIERLKQIVPIWKKEVWEDRTEWIGHQQGPWNPTASL